MAYRIEVEIAYNCRPKKGERRAKDGTGRLVKCSIFLGETFDECMADARANRAAAAEMAPGYTEVLAVRGYATHNPYTTTSNPTPDYTAAAL